MTCSLNLGIVAHVDAGKTSLTERLLHTAGAIDHIGSVDQGNTQTDSLALERQRGITIKSAVASFASAGVMVNIIDTPGHPDFIAEVERVLAVLDGVVLVVSAVEGVQPQTRILMRTLRRLGIPTLIFVNKIDRVGADVARTLGQISRKLTPSMVSMGAVHNAGTANARFFPYSAEDPRLTCELIDLLSVSDEQLMGDFVNGVRWTGPRLLGALETQSRQGAVTPVYFGSAHTGAGISILPDAITRWLPSASGEADAPLSGRVFKVERTSRGNKVAYVRLFAGSLHVRQQVPIGADAEGRVTGLKVIEPGAVVPRPRLSAGQIGIVSGLEQARVGDELGVCNVDGPRRYFAPPTLETVIYPRSADLKGTMRAALSELAEQDPLINVRQDDLRQETYVSLFGDVQKEVIQSTLATDYGVEVDFRETSTVCIERPLGVGTALEVINTDSNPFLGTVGLRVEPAAVGSGVAFALEVELGSMPPAFFRAVEEAVHATLREGLYGWRVTDCLVTMTHCGYWARQSRMGGTFDSRMSSTAGGFRNLTPLVLMDALRRSRTAVFEPMQAFHLEVPTGTFPAVWQVMAGLRAVVHANEEVSETSILAGALPVASAGALARRLPSLTHGEGAMETRFDHYQRVRGEYPTRSRSDSNPLNRRQYLVSVTKGAAGAKA
ncbi:elongation factor G [Natronoglycomyces albus]|uniref:TetM/TetW/TetO/TetS family tetracycline resistance ribosomal protection protein n=1 Tax=Natronoglycomyces albus TaxID=2811108 RepID=A0A895XP74_9ACTN|nr:TetM/TetW/TetO/TetS family tetracycline resistance ribosomal protection protein [Natronoglycomyces albus]QSB04090.1 TetM/TetW/TetO/TetS family tetracycline resistance ribosomal protection protein [Natronoglycomyces albus]